MQSVELTESPVAAGDASCMALRVMNGMQNAASLDHLAPPTASRRLSQPTTAYTETVSPWHSATSSNSTSFGCGKGGSVSSAGWQVTLCDPIRHVSSRSGEAGHETVNCYS